MEKFKFEKLSAKDIHDYMMKHATDEQKKEFKEVAFVNNKKKVAVTIKNKVISISNTRRMMYFAIFLLLFNIY